MESFHFFLKRISRLSVASSILHTISYLLLENTLQLLCDSVADLGSLCRSTNVGSPNSLVDDDLDGLIDRLGQLWLLQRVLEHHADGEDHGDGVDGVLAGDVWGGA